MVDIDKAVIARIKKEGKTFEILVDCDKAIDFKHGKDIRLDDVLATDDIFTDVKMGEHAPDHDLKRIFGTDNSNKVAEIIIKEGDIQLTAEYKNKLREEKKKQIINLIHRNAIDPKTNLPHPIKRIELALEEARIHIDEFKRAENQVQDVTNKIKAILPLKYETREVAVKIPAKFAGSSYGVLKQFGKVTKDEWQNDGSLLAVLEIPAGLQMELTDRLNQLTHGEVDLKILKSF